MNELDIILRINEELDKSKNSIFLRTLKAPNEFSFVKKYGSEKKLPYPTKNMFKKDLYEIFHSRRSRRDFDKESYIKITELSAILYASIGTTEVTDGIYGFLNYPLRASPSAGGLHCIDVYIATYRVKGLSPGLYYYNYYKHSIGVLCDNCFPYTINSAINQSMLRDAAIILILVMNLKRGLWKYGRRFYKFCLIDTGIVAENAHLACTALDLASVMVAGFQKEKVSKALCLEKYEIPSLLITIGRSFKMKNQT